MALNLKRTATEYMRVLKITKKPVKAEYSASIKITGLGILLIGAIGLIIFTLAAISGYMPTS